MHCLRCHGLMVTLRLEDVGSSSLCFSGWQCLMCGEVNDPVITANRKIGGRSIVGPGKTPNSSMGSGSGMSGAGTGGGSR